MVVVVVVVVVEASGKVLAWGFGGSFCALLAERSAKVTLVSVGISLVWAGDGADISRNRPSLDFCHVQRIRLGGGTRGVG